MLEIIRIPLFMNLWLSQNPEDAFSRGKLLDVYVSGFSGDESMRFAVQYILPFAAKKMAEHGHFVMERADLSEAVDAAFSVYLEDERIFQNLLAPQDFHKKSLLDDRDGFVDLILTRLCFLMPIGGNSQKIRFTHQYFRDYFAARQIVNLLTALNAGYGNHFTQDEAQMFRKLGLGDLWFPERETEIYRMIGEILGDDRNRYHEDFWYEETPLDGLLDKARRYDAFRVTENVIRTMAAVRDNLLCGVDFSGTSLPLHLPCGVKFSKNGEEACDFSGCRVYDIGFVDSELECVAASKDGTKQLLLSEDGYGLLWDAGNRVVLAEYWNTLPMDLVDFVYYEDAVSIKDDAVKAEIAARLTHFMGCDFRGAKFLFEHTKGILRGMGAIVE